MTTAERNALRHLIDVEVRRSFAGRKRLTGLKSHNGAGPNASASRTTSDVPVLPHVNRTVMHELELQRVAMNGLDYVAA